MTEAKYIADLREALSVVTAILKDRDAHYGASSETSRRRIAEAEALLSQRPKIKVRETVDG